MVIMLTKVRLKGVNRNINTCTAFCISVPSWKYGPAKISLSIFEIEDLATPLIQILASCWFLLVTKFKFAKLRL